MTIKRPKYLYFIVVNLKGTEVLKFGISNKYERRFKEYRDPETVGYFVRMLSLYKTNDAKRIETCLKYYMRNRSKPIIKQEYFDLVWYDELIDALGRMGSFFFWKYKKLDISVTVKRNKKRKQ